MCALYDDLNHGLRTPNEGINQRYLKNWADVADKICFGRTWKFWIGIWFSAGQWRQFPHWASVVRGSGDHDSSLNQYYSRIFLNVINSSAKNSGFTGSYLGSRFLTSLEWFFKIFTVHRLEIVLKIWISPRQSRLCPGIRILQSGLFKSKLQVSQADLSEELNKMTNDLFYLIKLYKYVSQAFII